MIRRARAHSECRARRRRVTDVTRRCAATRTHPLPLHVHTLNRAFMRRTVARSHHTTPHRARQQFNSALACCYDTAPPKYTKSRYTQVRALAHGRFAETLLLLKTQKNMCACVCALFLCGCPTFAAALHHPSVCAVSTRTILGND
jgi:hypothetical protein